MMSVYYWLLQSVHRYFGHEVLVGFCPVGMFGSMLVPKVSFLAFSDRQQLHVFRPSGPTFRIFIQPALRLHSGSRINQLDFGGQGSEVKTKNTHFR